VSAILAALHERSITGRGQYIDVAAACATTQAVLSALIDVALASALPDPEHPDAWPDIVAHGS
jgi:crotonobetainyl-CoA:carnitine CoA-transferase CaiB-like acyl-CoA transferase